jgi:hypothetical protein
VFVPVRTLSSALLERKAKRVGGSEIAFAGLGQFQWFMDRVHRLRSAAKQTPHFFGVERMFRLPDHMYCIFVMSASIIVRVKHEVEG